MKERIGFDREVSLEWLDSAVELIQHSVDSPILRSTMKSRLIGLGLTSEAARKTALVLDRTWLEVEGRHHGIRDEALDLYRTVDRGERIWLHWGMTLLAFPFFRDIAEIVGSLFVIQDEVTMEQIRRRFTERWGSRATTNRALGRVVRTMLWWNTINRGVGKGAYKLGQSFSSDNIELQVWLAHALVLASAADAIPVGQLLHAVYAYPFRFTIQSDDLRHSDKLKFYHEGSGLDMVTSNTR